MDQSTHATQATRIPTNIAPSSAQGAPPYSSESPPLAPWIKACIDACTACADLCADSASAIELHIPRPGPAFFTQLEDCVAACRNTAAMLARRSRYSAQACDHAAAACGKFLEACVVFDSSEPLIESCRATCRTAKAACCATAARERRASVGLAA